MHRRIAAVAAAVMIIQLLIPFGMIKYSAYCDEMLMLKGKTYDFAVTGLTYSVVDKSIYFSVKAVVGEHSGKYGEVITESNGQSYLCFTRYTDLANKEYVKSISYDTVFPPDTNVKLSDSFDSSAGMVLDNLQPINDGYFRYYYDYEALWGYTPYAYGTYAVTARAKVYRGNWAILGLYVNGKPIEDFINGLYQQAEQ